MNKEQIEEAAQEHCVIDRSIYNDSFQSYYIDGFKDGADWRINSAWHDIKEKPDFKTFPILLECKKYGNIHFIDETPTNWGWMPKYYTRWAYINDLLPNTDR